MRFQPFGYRFELSSHLRPDEVKSAIAARKKGWFDLKSGARGWVLGSYFCFWNSAFDRWGPMVIGRIADDNIGTTLKGRAGSNLNGVIALTLALPLFGFAFYETIWQDGSDEAAIAAWFFMGFLVLLSFWTAHTSRRDADVLVRFLQDSLAPKRKTVRNPPAAKFGGGIVLNINGERKSAPASAESLLTALNELGGDDFLILERDAGHYMQAVSTGDYFLVEWCDGGDTRFFRAYRKVDRRQERVGGESLLALDEAFDVLCTFGTGAPASASVDWVPEKP